MFLRSSTSLRDRICIPVDSAIRVHFLFETSMQLKFEACGLKGHKFARHHLGSELSAFAHFAHTELLSRWCSSAPHAHKLHIRFVLCVDWEMQRAAFFVWGEEFVWIHESVRFLTKTVTGMRDTLGFFIRIFMQWFTLLNQLVKAHVTLVAVTHPLLR